MEKRTLKQAFNTIFHGKYDFEDFCNLNVSKETEPFVINNKKIYRTSVKLRDYQRFIEKVLLRYLSVDNKIVHSFIKGNNTLTAVEAHSNNKYFFQTDIKNFYGSIDRNDVMHILSRDADNIPVSDFKYFIDNIINLTTFDGFIPIGFITSPQLSNAHLYEFDKVLKKYCDSKELIYTRYADDIIISGASFNDISDLGPIISKLLKEYASDTLVINIEKTKITHKGNKVKILGLVILPNGRVTVDSKYKRKIETLIHFYINEKSKYEDFLNENFNGNISTLFGLLHYIRSVDKKYLEKLQKKYGAYTLRKLMEESGGNNG